MKRYFKTYGFMFAVDLLVAALLWLVWIEVNSINGAIAANAESIRLYGSIFMLLIGLVVPVLHIIFTLDFVRPGFADKGILKKIKINKLLLLLFIALFIVPAFIKTFFIRHIESSGYVYCPQKSERTSFSKILVFVDQKSKCTPE